MPVDFKPRGVLLAHAAALYVLIVWIVDSDREDFVRADGDGYFVAGYG
jgi:hypothetical protein